MKVIKKKSEETYNERSSPLQSRLRKTSNIQVSTENYKSSVANLPFFFFGRKIQASDVWKFVFSCNCPIDEIISLRFLLTTLIVHSLCDRRILFCYFIPKWKCKIQVKYVYQHATASQTKGAEINKVVCAYSGSILLYISLIMSNLVAKDMEIKMICYILLFVWYIIYSHLYL